MWFKHALDVLVAYTNTRVDEQDVGRSCDYKVRVNINSGIQIGRRVELTLQVDACQVKAVD